MPSLVGARPGRRKLPQEFEWSSVLLSVLGAFSVLLGCDMTNTSCCSAVAVCERRVLFLFFFLVSTRGAKKVRKSFPRKHPGNVLNASVLFYT